MHRYQARCEWRVFFDKTHLCVDPFNEQCGAAFNPLYWTPGYCFDPTKPSTPNCTSTGAIAKFNQTGYQNIKQVYDMLQYNGTPFQDNIPLVATMFDHYVALIYGSQYLNSLNAYSYSVDDDVGNFQGTGTGAYIAVGGTQNLPNPNNAAFPVHVNVGALTNGLFFTSYSIGPGSPPQFCSGGNSTTIANNSFVLGAYMNYMPAGCPIFLVDNKATKYTFTIKRPPNGPPAWGPNCANDPRNCVNDMSMIDCTGNQPGSKQARWCSAIFGYQEFNGGASQSQQNNNIQTQPPPDR